MTSMRQIAEEAGVTPMTVSRALRPGQSVDPATRQRILEIAAARGYALDPRVSRLMTQMRTGAGPRYLETLAWIWPDAVPAVTGRNTYLRRLYSGAAQRAAQIGYQLDEFWLATPGLPRRRFVEILVSRGIRGLVFAPFINVSRARLNFSFQGFACAAVGEALWRPRLHHTRFDHYLGMRQAIHVLKNQGYRHIAFAIDALTNSRAHLAFEACFLAHHPAGSREARQLCFTDAHDQRQFRRWLLARRPDVLIGPADYFVEEIQQAGLRVPEQIAFASLNVTSVESPCSGINQQEELIAGNAVDLVVEQLQHGVRGPPATSKVVITEGSWHWGTTTRRHAAKAAQTHKLV